jgi:hypothetical protein
VNQLTLALRSRRPPLASINKSLAEMNKSRDVVRATKGISASRCGREKNGSPPTLLPHAERRGPNLNPLCYLGPGPGKPPSTGPGPLSPSVLVSVMTSDDSLSLILRRLDEIERKLLDRMMEELRPTAIGYSVRRGNLPRKD